MKIFTTLVVLAFLTTTPALSKNITASYYKTGKVTANGEKFDPHGMTVAHKKLRFNTKLRLTYKNKSVIVRVNDRGPFIPGRELDLTLGVKNRLGCPDICKLKMEIINP